MKLTRWRTFVWGAHVGAFLIIVVAREVQYRREWERVRAELHAWAESMKVMFP